MIFTTGTPSWEATRTFGGFNVPVNDALLMGMLHGLTEVKEKLEPLAWRQPVVVAVLGDGHALDQLHDEVRPAAGGFASVVNLGDIGMIHQRQRLPLGFKARDHLTRVHAGFEDLEGNLTADRLLLLGDEDQAHAAFADLFHQTVRADNTSGTLADRRVKSLRRSNRGAFQELSLVIGGQQRLNVAAQAVIPGTGAVQKRGPLPRILFLQGLGKHGFLAGAHG
jgi:hypothetical protein